MAGGPHLPPCPVIVRASFFGNRVSAGQPTSALGPGPPANGLSRDFLRECGSGSGGQLPPRQYADSAPAAEMGDSRNDPGYHALHAFLRHPLSLRLAPWGGHESVGTFSGSAATYIRLRHFPLSPD